MERTNSWTRRSMLVAGTAAAGSAFLTAGCDALSTEPSDDRGGSGAGAEANKGPEAPMLAEQVESGQLPKVADRLPANPLVVQPLERIGVYGGDWMASMRGPDDTAWLERTVGYEYLMRWDPAFEEVIPNVAEEITAEDGGRAYLVRLREGIRWSDGELFTADDVLFAYNDVLRDPDLYPEGPYSFYTVNDELAELEKVDDHTLRFSFAEPNGLFPQNLATPYAWHLTAYAKHHFERFHQKFNSEVAQLAESEGHPDWVALFLEKEDRWINKDRPLLFPWLPETVFGEGSRVVWVRNPYYWKVDPDGGQLPYLDRMVNEIIQDTETMVLKAAQGEIDFQDRSINAPVNKPVLARAREESDFRFVNEPPTNSVTFAIALNLNHKDAVKRELFRNVDFRIGLSHAINRQQIIDTVYQRQGEPYQVAPRPDSPFYDEEMGKQYTEYDPGLANEHLDRVGLTDRDGEGFRLGPDGQRVVIGVETVADGGTSDPLELVKADWAEVGVELRIMAEGRELFEERRLANEHDATTWGAEGGGRLEPILRTDWYFPSGPESRNYAPLWYEWYETGGASGEAPPELVRQQMELYGRVRQTVDETERNDLMMEVLALAKEYFYHIGISLAPDWYGVVKNNFHNVPQEMPASFIYPTPGPSNPEQYFKST